MDAVEKDILSMTEIDKERADKCRVQWQKLLERIWALGPRHIGPNILFIPDFKRRGAEQKGKLIRKGWSSSGQWTHIRISSSSDLQTLQLV
jgi:ribosome assembly protein 1